MSIGTPWFYGSGGGGGGANLGVLMRAVYIYKDAMAAQSKIWAYIVDALKAHYIELRGSAFQFQFGFISAFFNIQMITNNQNDNVI